MKPSTMRTGADRCPGALQPFAAEDGLIVRARIPGGEVAASTLRLLMQLGVEYGTPRIQLTTRANLQIRGLDDPMPSSVAERMADGGLLPSMTHERARNILAAPTNRRMRDRARQLDRLLQERPVLAALPGRFLILLTDASGIGLSEPYDIAYVDNGDGTGRLLAGGRARPCGPDRAFDAVLDLAERFLAERADERVWNIRDLPAQSPVLQGLQPVEISTMTKGDPYDAQGDNKPLIAEGDNQQLVATAPLVPGPHGNHLVVGVPLGLLEPTQLEAVCAVTDSVVVTPWRSLLIEGAAPRADALAATGLVTTSRSPWTRISACTGAPHCARAVSETLDLARECAAELPVDGPRLHLVGCARRCGSPRGAHITVVGARTVNDVRNAAG